MNAQYHICCMDGAEGMCGLHDNSVKLLYTSPPYPNAVRDYGVWRVEEYLEKIDPFISTAYDKLKNDGFLILNLKACREKSGSGSCTKRSLIVEKLAILLEEQYDFTCVDIEIWYKTNPVPTGLRAACQDAYEQILWYSKSKSWVLDIDAIRRPYTEKTLKKYSNNIYRPRKNGLSYVTKEKMIDPNPLGCLPINVISGAVSSKQVMHQAVQPQYLSEKYIKTCTKVGDLVCDPFLGSGTTGLSALQLGRNFIGWDIISDNINYCANIFQNFGRCV